MKFIDLRSDGSRIDVVDRPDFAFDPRTRPWYVKAAATNDQVLTDPYVFFTTREPGITFARKARSGRGVVGADITLTNLSELLRQQRVAPSTQLFLLTGSGLVVARNGAGSIARTDAASGEVRLAPLSEIPHGVASALAPRFGTDVKDRNFTFVAAGSRVGRRIRPPRRRKHAALPRRGNAGRRAAGGRSKDSPGVAARHRGADRDRVAARLARGVALIAPAAPPCRRRAGHRGIRLHRAHARAFDRARSRPAEPRDAGELDDGATFSRNQRRARGRAQSGTPERARSRRDDVARAGGRRVDPSLRRENAAS